MDIYCGNLAYATTDDGLKRLRVREIRLEDVKYQLSIHQDGGI